MASNSIWLAAGVRTPFVVVDGPFAHRDSLTLSVPVVQDMAARVRGPIDSRATTSSSGPSIPPTGGILIARAESIEDLNECLADEPYCKAKVMRFSKITEFDPVQHQSILRDWFAK
jgi:hypothetical protein